MKGNNFKTYKVQKQCKVARKGLVAKNDAPKGSSSISRSQKLANDLFKIIKEANIDLGRRKVMEAEGVQNLA